MTDDIEAKAQLASEAKLSTELIPRNSLKITFLQLPHHSFATEYSRFRMNEFHKWITDNQLALSKTAGAEDAHFIGIAHGSVGRGHATTEPDRQSDLDGTIFYDDPKHSMPPSSLEELFQSDDWGVRFENISDLIHQMQNIDKTSSTFDEGDYTKKRELFAKLAHPIGCLFGPASITEENAGIIDEWRARVIKQIAELKGITPGVFWRLIQDKWHIDFVHYQKREGEVENAISAYVHEQGNAVTEENIEKVRQQHMRVELPDFKRLAAEYV